MTQPFLRAGRTASHPPAHAPNAALLIDFDNVTLGIRSDLAKELRTLLNSDIIKGKVAVQRAYADWRRYPQYIVPLSESSIDLIFAPAFGSTKKNATDIRLAVDAIELVFTRPEIGTYILLSGDSDFSSMVLKLKEYGKYVIGVGIRESASDLLIQNCDEYYSYNDLAGLSRAADAPTTKRDPWELVKEAVAQMVRNDDVMRSDRLKQVMQQLDSNFDERDLGYSRFSKFVVDAGQKGLLQVSKLENGQYEVAPAATVAASAPAAPAAGTAAPAADDAGRRGSRRGRGRGGRDRERGERPERGERGERERPRDSGAVRAPDAARSLTLARAFELLNHALSELGGGPVGEEPLRARMAALHGREDALLEPARFQRLLRQANDAEVADVRKTDDESLEVTAPRIDVRMSRTRADAGRGARKPVDPAVVKAVDADVIDDADGDLTAPAAPVAPAAPPAEEIPAAPVAASAAGATRMGLRFRRGSRAPVRGGGVPLVGAVASSRAEPVTAATPAATEANGAKPPVADAEKPAAEARPAKAAKRGGRAKAAKGSSTEGAGRKPAAKAAKGAKSAAKAAAAPPAPPPPEGGDAKPVQPRRARPRARKAAKE